MIYNVRRRRPVLPDGCFIRPYIRTVNPRLGRKHASMKVLFDRLELVE